MKIKKTYNTTKYYQGNRKVSKTQGIIFMIIGFIILAPLLNTFGRFALNIFYEPPLHADCDREDIKSLFSDYRQELSQSTENTETLKNKYYNQTGEETYKAWRMSFLRSLDLYEKNRVLHNQYPHYKKCFDYSINDEMNTRKANLLYQSKLLQEESTKYSN